MKDMRTPLSRVRGLGSAKEGTEHFWRQRITAIANIPLIIAFCWLVISLVGAPYQEVMATLSNPFIAILLVLLILSVTVHMKLGMQVVIEDYVHGELNKVLLLLLNTFFAVAIGAISIFSILKLAFAG